MAEYRVQPFNEWRKIVAHRALQDRQVDGIVAVDEAVAHADDCRPGHIRVTKASFLRHPGGCLANDLNEPGQGKLQFPIRREIFPRLSAAHRDSFLRVVARCMLIRSSCLLIRRRRLLNIVHSNSTWREGRLVPEYRKPFDALAVTNAAWLKEKAVSGVEDGMSSIWLPFVDTYRTLCQAPNREVTRVLRGMERTVFLQQ